MRAESRSTGLLGCIVLVSRTCILAQYKNPLLGSIVLVFRSSDLSNEIIIHVSEYSTRLFSPASLAWLGYIDYGRLLYMYPHDATVDLRFVEDTLILIHFI